MTANRDMSIYLMEALMNRRNLVRMNSASIMGTALFGVLVSLFLILSLPAPSAAVSFDLNYSVTDDGVPSSFTYNFSQSLPNLSSWIGSINFSATITDGGDEAISADFTQVPTLTVTSDEGISQLELGSFPNVTFIGHPTLPPITLSNLALYGPFSCSFFSFSPSCTFDNIELSYAFNGSGGGDRYDFIGKLTIDNLDLNTVPEPATLLLLGSGMAGLILIRRKFTA